LSENTTAMQKILEQSWNSLIAFVTIATINYGWFKLEK